ncbi:TetR/AcrR family transcriptional regulator [Amycolatopsis thermophila]|uniref:AcrR family transcriptional regulator n=1 Tax=Amycolatopsis thermophila TaxID=206084 RepID=A0ABU0ER47_9PSEU|nr:TetR/AcrR family transcriptional regulator [Amycolatopsis thermophila]MDQ0377634.1 AcrR family transcriptional regulator [Amycolatopsis thermophila]
MRRTQEERSQSTRAALMAAARELFAERGYQAVPADEIVRAAGVTRGALYHHYGDKQGLFRAVFEELEVEVTAEVEAATKDAPDLASGLLFALKAFLDACERDECRQIALIDAPAVLGWTTWREIEAEHGLGLVVGLLDQAVGQGLLKPAPVAVLGQLVLSAVNEAALMIAHADNPAQARSDAEQVLAIWLMGLLVE